MLCESNLGKRNWRRIMKSVIKKNIYRQSQILCPVFKQLHILTFLQLNVLLCICFCLCAILQCIVYHLKYCNYYKALQLFQVVLETISILLKLLQQMLIWSLFTDVSQHLSMLVCLADLLMVRKPSQLKYFLVSEKE